MMDHAGYSVLLLIIKERWKTPIHKKDIKMRKIIDLTEKRFGKLIVIKIFGRAKNGSVIFQNICL